jgi:hypothetical protein
MEDVGENTRMLIEAGVIPGPVPEPYRKAIEDMGSDELGALIRLKERLDRANEDYGGKGDVGFICMVVPL